MEHRHYSACGRKRSGFTLSMNNERETKKYEDTKMCDRVKALSRTLSNTNCISSTYSMERYLIILWNKDTWDDVSCDVFSRLHMRFSTYLFQHMRAVLTHSSNDMSPVNLLGMLLILSFQAAPGQPIGCYVPGECTQSPYINGNETDSATDCLLYCQVIDKVLL